MPHSRNVEAVLFDMDETLLEHTCSFREIGARLFDRYEQRLAPVTQSEFWDTYWAKTLDMWFMMLDGAISGDLARHYSFVNTLRALKLPEDLAASLLSASDAEILASTRLFAETIPVLTQLRAAGFKTGIVTNGYTSLQRLKLDHHGLLDLVDFALVSEEVGSHKPDAGIFHTALERAGAPAEACIFVGDMPDTDIKGANGVGLASVLVRVGGHWADIRNMDDAIEASHTIDSLSELPPLLGLR